MAYNGHRKMNSIPLLHASSIGTSPSCLANQVHLFAELFVRPHPTADKVICLVLPLLVGNRLLCRLATEGVSIS